MNTLFSGDFRIKDLHDLEELKYVLELTYGDWGIEKRIYENIIWSLARCTDLAAAQSRLDLITAIIYEELSFLVKGLKVSDFLTVINDIDTDLLDKTLQELRGNTKLEAPKDETGNIN
jgi:hypothetical protein